MPRLPSQLHARSALEALDDGRRAYTWAVRALLVALDLPTAGLIGSAIEREWAGSVVSLAESIEDARALLAREHIDVVFLGGSAANGGLQLCADVCESAPLPVLLVADRRGLIDRVRAAQLGIQGILWRPLSENALVRAVHAAVATAQAPDDPSGTFSAGSIHMNYETRSVTVDGRAMDLTATEYRLLYHLTRNANSVLAYETLLAKVWGRQHVADREMLKAHVDNLSLKFPRGGPGSCVIVKHAGFGFALRVSANEVGG